MKVLAIETSTITGSIAVLDVDNSSQLLSKVLSQTSWQRQRSHSELVTASIQETLTQAQLDINDISLIAVDPGPGSFTGARVAVNAAKALAYSLNLPIVPIDSLYILAAGVFLTSENYRLKPVLVMVNAFKNMIYRGVYQWTDSGLKVLHSPKAVKVDELDTIISTSHICIGDGYEVYQKQFSHNIIQNLSRIEADYDYPKAEILGRLALQTQWLSQQINWQKLTPIYLRASEAEDKLASGLLKPVQQRRL